jgi:hypothetical protein
MALIQTDYGSSAPLVKFAMVKCNCCTRLVPGKIIMWADKPENIPLHMPCVSCEKKLSHIEEDSMDVLGRMCIECFEEMTL